MLTLGDLRKLKRYLLCFALLTCSIVYAQKIDTVFNRRVVRQYVAVKYNFGMMGAILGTEVQGIVAPLNWLHVQCSYRVYEAALSGLMVGSAHRMAWDVFTDVRFHFPFNRTFTGFFIGPYYGIGQLNLRYKERLYVSDPAYYDSFEIHRQVIGGVYGFSYCARKFPRIVWEFHAGLGKAVYRRIEQRGTYAFPFIDHTEQANKESQGQLRFGLCIGYVFH